MEIHFLITSVEKYKRAYRKNWIEAVGRAETCGCFQGVGLDQRPR